MIEALEQIGEEISLGRNLYLCVSKYFYSGAQRTYSIVYGDNKYGNSEYLPYFYLVDPTHFLTGRKATNLKIFYRIIRPILKEHSLSLIRLDPSVLVQEFNRLLPKFDYESFFTGQLTIK